MLRRVCAKQANFSVSISETSSPSSVWILTEVQHGWNKSPSDDKLAALEQLLQPLLGLFAQFSHVFISKQRGCCFSSQGQGKRK